MTERIRYLRDADGVVTLTWTDPGDANALSEAGVAAFDTAVSRVLDDGAAVGAIVASGQRDFLLGQDLRELDFTDLDRVETCAERLRGAARRMETGGKPFVAVLAGSALGSGAELALACHRRVGTREATDARFGFPDVSFGLAPGCGATQRTPRIVGIVRALPLLLEGRRLRFDEALSLGLIDELVEASEAAATARAWILANPRARRAWDGEGFSYPGGTAREPSVADAFLVASATLRKKTWGNHPVTRDILSSVYEGSLLDFDAALRVEARYFRAALARPEARAMVKTLFFATNAANAATAEPAGTARASFTTVGVIGAGMMGAGIALVAARAGLDVALLDRDLASAERGKARAGALGADEAALARISPGVSFAALANAQLAIEAVFEDRELKADVTRRAEANLSATAVIASNTSTLPIGSLAAACARPERFVGMHFFSLVERMALVEIIRGPSTSDATLAVALDYVRRIGKTPIVVRDGRGFFTSRVFATYVHEGLALLREGVPAATIENAGRLAGMAVGPLAVADEVGFGLLHDVVLQSRRDLGAAYVAGVADDTIEALATRLDRPGKARGRGIYTYAADGTKSLWNGLGAAVARGTSDLPVDVVMRRLLYVQVLEARRCFTEGAIERTDMGDVGSILGWGFPGFTGGVFSFVEYVGAERFETERAALEVAYGARFARADGALAGSR